MSPRSPFTLARSATERDTTTTADARRRDSILRRIEAMPPMSARRRPRALPHVDTEAVNDAIEQLRPTD